jgi:hypothetical protein
MARFAYRNGASFMGWAAHDDRCRGFYAASNDELRRKLDRTARRRAEDFPRAAHYPLFGEGGEMSKCGASIDGQKPRLRDVKRGRGGEGLFAQRQVPSASRTRTR